MRFEKDVDKTDVSPVIWYYLPQIERVHILFTGAELTVKCLHRPVGSVVHNPSPGDSVIAADVHRGHLDSLRMSSTEIFCSVLNLRFGRALRIVLEPEWLTPADIEERGGPDAICPHIHVQVEDEVYVPVWL